MKKLVCFLIICALLSLSACGDGDVKDADSKDTTVESSAAPGSVEESSIDTSSKDTASVESVDDVISSEESSEEKEEVFTCGDYQYTRVNTVAMICAYKGKDKEISLPSELDGYTVTAIDGEVFANNKTVTKLIVSDTVVNVGDGAFKDCSSLTEVYIGSSVAVLQPDSFEGCSALEKIEVSSVNKNFSSVDGVLYKGDKSVLLCCPRSIQEEELLLPDAVTLVGENAFAFCKGVKKVKLPDGCQLSPGAFYYCMDLEEIEFGAGLTAIPDKCFFGCVTLDEISVPAGVTTLGDYSFFGCISAEKAVLPESVEEIGENVFKSCSALKKIEAEGEYCKKWYAETGKDYINT